MWRARHIIHSVQLLHLYILISTRTLRKKITYIDERMYI